MRMTRLACLMTALLAWPLPGALAHDDPRCGVAAAETPLDLNRATERQLQQLPGVGPARARAIVRLRDRRGGFTRIAQLLRVRGIGRATLRRLRPLLTVGPPARARGGSAANGVP